MKFLVLAVIALLSIYGCVAESEAQADAPFVSLMEAEAQSLERTKSHLQQQIAQTMARQMALQKESAIRSASDLAAMKLQLEHKRLQARRQHLLNEMKLSSSALNKLGHGELQIDNTYGAKHEPAAPSLVQLSDTPRLELTDEPQPQPQPQPHAQAQTPAHAATRRLTFPTAAGDMECECRMAARRHEAATHAPAREHAPAHASAPAQKPIKGAADKTAPWIHAPVDGSLPPVFGLPCFENCQEYKCRKDFPTYGFDHFHECVISCVEKCYKGDENALKVAEVAFHHQEVVNGKVAKRLKEEFIEGLH